MPELAEVLAIAAVVLGSSGAIWYRMGQLEESVKRLPCRDQNTCPDPAKHKED